MVCITPLYLIQLISSKVNQDGVQHYFYLHHFNFADLNSSWFALSLLMQANFGKKLGTSINCTPARMDPVFFLIPLKGRSDASRNARTRTFIYLF